MAAVVVEMPVAIHAVGVDALPRYAAIPSAFEVHSILRVEVLDAGWGGFRLVEDPVDPYVQDYDRTERPTDWPAQFDLSRWAFFLAADGERDVGAAAVAFDTPAVHMLEGRRDLAVLWDIRVRPEARGQGVGARLFRCAAAWARERGCRQLKVETQNVNLPACRFYAAQGCELGAIHRFAYAACPEEAHETMLLWYLQLDTHLDTQEANQ